MAKITPPAQLLLRDVETFLRHTKMPRTTFGVNAAGDGHFIARLEGGREPRHATVERVRRYLSKHEGSHHGKEKTRPQVCEECGKHYANPPSRFCPGCKAYRAHQTREG